MAKRGRKEDNDVEELTTTATEMTVYDRKALVYTCFIMVRELDEYRAVDKFYVPSDKEISPELITEFMSTKDRNFGKLVSKALEEWRHDESVVVSIGNDIAWFSASGISTTFEAPILISQEYLIWIHDEAVR